MRMACSRAPRGVPAPIDRACPSIGRVTDPTPPTSPMLELITSRRSAPALTTPAPTDEQLRAILAAGASVPDHGRLRPYRFVVVAGEARRRFGLDSLTRRLRSIDAKDHSFGGKLDELAAELRSGVDWVMGELTPHHRAP